MLSSLRHAENRKNDILIPGRDLTQVLGNTKLTAEKEYTINFSDQQEKFCLSLHYNGANRYLFVNDV